MSFILPEHLQESLSHSYFYKSRRINSTRKSKTCDICSSSIPVKSNHLVFKMFNDEYYDFDICPECEKNTDLLNAIKAVDNY